MKPLRIILPIVIIGLSVIAAGFLYATKPEVEAQAPAERVWQVSVIEADPGPRSISVEAFGTVVAARTVELTPLVAGQVIDASPALVAGGIVKKGDILVQIDPFDFETEIEIQRAELEQSRSKLAEIAAQIDDDRRILATEREKITLAQRDVERRAALQQRSVGSEKASDDARLTLKEYQLAALSRERNLHQMEAQLDQQHARIAQLEALLSRREKDLERATVRAPYDAVVVETQTAVGRYVRLGDPLATLIDSDSLEVRFHVPLATFSRLAERGPIIGTPTEIVWRAGDVEWVFSGQVKRQIAEIDATLGGVELFSSIDGGARKSIVRPGAFVEVRLDLGQTESVARVPSTAVHDGNFVFVVDGSRLERRDVDTVGTIGDVFLVTGLRQGEIVATSRFPGMAADMKVSATRNPPVQ